MKLSFHGAAKTVTGSCHLLECLGKRILIDCGMLQGSREFENDNRKPFGFDAAAVDMVLLTHAHLDHCGRLALLKKRGFRGEVIATSATFDLARLVMLDAAHMQEEEFRNRTHHLRMRGAPHPEPPIYTLLDATQTLSHFGRAANYGAKIELASGISATFYDAGHILGSASILVEVDEVQQRRTILFSGDIGNAGRPLLRPPQTPPSAQFVVMESTYGDRSHKPFPFTLAEFYEAITSTFNRGGNVVIPTFALERAQELLYFLRQGVDDGLLPRTMPVFVDSPMAVSATEIFEHHPESYNPVLADFFARGKDPFSVPGLKLVRERSESMAINKVSGGAIIMAGSGMCTGGRIRHHLRHNLWNSDASIIFVGYAAPGTPARYIIDGAKNIELFGDHIPVRARIYTINGFSAHADQQELMAWNARIAEKEITFLVHGDGPVMVELEKHLSSPRVEIPDLNQSFEL
jgi:metallo-beta-lactamase family protein